MKKYLSVILSIVLIFTVLPNSVYAENPLTTNTCVERMTKDDVVALACEAFPEYAADIRDGYTLSNSGTSTYGLSRETVEVNETRALSDTKSVTYQKLSNGVELLSVADISVTTSVDWNYESASEGVVSSHYDVDLIVTCNVSEGYVVIGDIEYTIMHSDYDSISSAGAVNGDMVDADGSLYSLNRYETASGPARATYLLIFEVEDIYELLGEEHISITAYFNVGSNQAYMNCYCLPDSL